MTGGQPLADGPDFAALARASGIDGGGATRRGKVERIETLDEFAAELPRLLTEPGPHFVVLPVENHEPLPPVNHSDHAGRIRQLRRAPGV
jgi:thiamine pyrophosphate-dependent acetolactate synthase large subunit-like protein